MKDLVLPISCKTRDSILWCYALVVCPIIFSVAIIMQLFLGYDLLKHAYILLPMIIQIAFFIVAVLTKTMDGYFNGKLPTIRCKCDEDVTK